MSAFRHDDALAAARQFRSKMGPDIRVEICGGPNDGGWVYVDPRRLAHGDEICFPIIVPKDGGGLGTTVGRYRLDADGLRAVFVEEHA